jgi:hypothetical protein
MKTKLSHRVIFWIAALLHMKATITTSPKENGTGVHNPRFALTLTRYWK